MPCSVCTSILEEPFVSILNEEEEMVCEKQLGIGTGRTSGRWWALKLGTCSEDGGSGFF